MVIIMVNDRTTIAGSLQEVIDRLEAKIQAKGVSEAEFDPETGIIGLIDYIDDIQTGPVYALSVSSDKDILSFSDQETATLTATLTYDAVPIADETISYSIEHNGTVIDSGSDTTDANGEVELEYDSTGVGDVEIIFSYGILLQETFVVQDCTAYSDCTSSTTVEAIFDVPSNVKNSTYTFDSTGWKYGNVSPYTNILLQSSITLTKPMQISMKIIENNGAGLSWNIGKIGSNWVYLDISSGNIRYCGTNIKSISYGSEYKVKVYSDKIEVYEDDTLIKTDNSTLTEWYVALGTGTNRYVKIKDFKIKAL